MGKRTKARLKSKSKKTKRKSVKKVKRKVIRKKTVRKSKPKLKKKFSKNKAREKTKIKTKTKTVSTKPLTLDLWNKARDVKIKNKKDSLEAFVKIVNEVERKKYSFKEGIVSKGSYYIVNEEVRNGSSFVHIVPKEAYPIFSEIMQKMPNVILGFSILCGKNRMRDLRVSCFGISSSEVTKALIKG